MKTKRIPTNGELEVLILILTSDFCDYPYEDKRRIGYPVWTVADTPKQKGNLSSCIKQGWVGNENEEKGYETVFITEDGYEAYQSTFNKN